LKYQYFNVGQNLGIQSSSVRPSPTIQQQNYNPPTISPVVKSPPKPKQEEKPYNYSSPYNHSPYGQPSPQPFTEQKNNPSVLPQYGKQHDNVSIYRITGNFCGYLISAIFCG